MKKLLSKIEERTEHMENSHQERVAVTSTRKQRTNNHGSEQITMDDEPQFVASPKNQLQQAMRLLQSIV